MTKPRIAAGRHEELAELAVPRVKLVVSAVRRQEWDVAAALAEEARSEHALAHDGLRDVNARTLDEIHRRYGQEFADPFCSAVYEETTVWYVAKAPEPATFREAVEAVAMLWHWHMTTFRLKEDRDKASFILEPCGSGGRLINEGAYYASGKRPLSILANASITTFGESDFPSYCTHCADHNRTFLKRGFNIMVFEGWTRAHRYGTCLSHVFKRLDDLPEEFYARIGVDRAEVPQTDYQPEHAVSVFSDEELQTLSTHPVDRLKEAVGVGDGKTALALMEQSWASWMGLHGAYRVWYTAFCNHMRDGLGSETAAALMDECAWWLVAHAFDAIGADKDEPLRVWSRFWRSHGEPVEIEEDADSWVFRTPPAALIDAQLSQGWSRNDLARFCEAVTRGAAREGHASDFGTLELRGDFLEHRLLVA
jgi:hypothetical protein